MEENASTIIVRRRRKESSDSKAFKFGLKFVLGLLVLILFLTLVRCTVRKPEAPTWSTNLTLPLINRTYLMPEIIRKIDQPGLSLDSSGEVVFSFTHELDTIRVSDNLNTPDLHRSTGETLGLVSIAPLGPGPLTVNLSNYAPLIMGQVPPMSFDITNDFPFIEEYSWVTISSGNMTVILVNDFGVDLDTVIVELYDQIYARTVATQQVSSPGLLAGEADTIIADMAGQTVSNQFRLNLHCHTPGGLLLSLDDKTLTSGLDCGNQMNVSAAEAEIPRIEKEFSETVTLAESGTIMSAQLASGTLALTISNQTNLSSRVQISLPDFTLDNIPYALDRLLAASENAVINVDLTGYRFEPLDQSVPQEIRIEVAAIIDSTAPTKVIIDQYDSIAVSADLSGLNFASLTGVIDAAEAAFDDINFEIDLPKGFDSIQLVNAELLLEIENGVNFPGTLDLSIQGNGGQTLNLNGEVLPGSPDNPVFSYIIDTNLAAFLNPVPSSLTINGAAILGDGVTLGTVTDRDYVFSRIQISSPLEVVIAQTAFEGDISSEEIEQDDIDRITDHVRQARFISSLTNHLPLGVSVEIYLGGDSLSVYDNPELVVGPIVVAAGQIGAGNVVASPTVSENILTLDSADIQILKHPRLYAGQVITLASSNGQPVKISGSDYVSASGVLEVEYNFDGEF